MKTLSRGEKLRLTELSATTQLQVRLDFKASSLGFDFSCFGLDDNSKLSDDRYMVFYNQKQSPGSEIRLLALNAQAANFGVDLARLPSSVRRLVFVATIDGVGSMSQLEAGRFLLGDASGAVGQFSFAGRDFTSEKAVMVAEIYFKGEWRVAANGQGFREGLSAVLKHFGGVETNAPTPPAAPAPRHQAPVPPPPAPRQHPVVPRPAPAVPPCTAYPVSPAPIPQPLFPQPASAPAPSPANAANACADCGKALNLLERGLSSANGVKRCGACERQLKQRQQMEAQQHANAQLALRQQTIERIINGDLPIVQPTHVGIVLKRGEVCHFVTHADYYEERVTGKVTVKQGSNARVRLGRGVTYRVGVTTGRTISVSDMVQIDSGRLIMTNQRCVFDGQRKSFSIPFAKLISFDPYANGIELNPENKKTQQFRFQDGEMAAAILSTVLNL